jgi:hypothetical protein
MSRKLGKIIIFGIILLVVIIAVVFLVNYNQNNLGTGMLAEGDFSSNQNSSSSPSKTGIQSQAIDSITAPNEGVFDQQDSTKIIKKSNITMQTDNYDSSIQSINDLIKSLEAMVVKMQETQGNSYSVMNTSSSKLRTADMTIKVSKDKFEDFNTELKTYANVLSYYEEAQDISSSYADVESKISSYKLQEQQLNELMKKATAAKDLLEISNQIQNVIQQREYLQKQKNSYDNQIEYSTVVLRLTEVQSVDIKEKSIFTRIKDSFESSISGMKEISINVIMFIVYIVPYMIILAILAFIVNIIIKVNNRKRK